MQNKLKSVRFSCIILAHQHFLDIEYCIPEEKMLLSKWENLPAYMQNEKVKPCSKKSPGYRCVICADCIAAGANVCNCRSCKMRLKGAGALSAEKNHNQRPSV